MYRSAYFNKTGAQLSGVAAAAPVVHNSIVAQAPFTLFANQTSSRVLKFPSSRKFLWDRTPLGRAEVVELKDNLPVVSIPNDFHLRIGPDSVTVANVTYPNGSRLHISLQSAAPSHEPPPGSLVVPLTVSTGGLSTDQLATLLQNLQRGLDRRGGARFSTSFALALALQTSCGRESAGDAARSSSSSATLTATLLLPAATLSLTPLYAKRLCDVPLAQTLSQHGPEAGVQTGYLTMDQARSLIPMAVDDSNVYSVPLVGVWVSGVRGTDHPAVYAAALQFAYASTLPDRAVQSDGAFLLLVFTGESSVARCYEARFTDAASPRPQSQPRPHGPDARPGLLSPTGGASGIGGAVVDGGGCSGFGGSGLRVLPYLVRAELTGETAAPLELKPMLDAVMAATAGLRLTLPSGKGAADQTLQTPAQAGATPSDTATTPHGGVGNQAFGGGRPVSAAAPGSTSHYGALAMFPLRGSGSKLMTSPSKAMKILAGGGGTMYGGAGGGSSCSSGANVAVKATEPGWNGIALYGAGDPAAPPPWAAPGAGFVRGVGALRDSPPLPRSSAVPTPFRMSPGPSSDSARAPGSVDPAAASSAGRRGGGYGGNAGADGVAVLPRDPRLQHRAATCAEAFGEGPAPGGGPRKQPEDSVWTSSSARIPGPSSSQHAIRSAAASGGDLPVARVSASGTATMLSAPSRAGSIDWGDSASGVMVTPAAPFARRDAPFFAATPVQSHDTTGPYAHLQQQPYATSVDAVQRLQHQEQPEQQRMRQPIVPGLCGAMAWTTPGVLQSGVRGSNAAHKSEPAAVSVAEPVAAQKHGHGLFSSGQGLGQQASAASLGPTEGNIPVANASAGRSGACRKLQASHDDGLTGTRLEAAASQSLDRWLHSNVRASDCGAAAHTSAASVAVPAAWKPSADAPAYEAAAAAERNRCYGVSSYGGEVAWQPIAASQSSLGQAASGPTHAPPLHRPASAGPRHAHAHRQADLSQQRPQHRPSAQAQQPPHQQPHSVHVPHRGLPTTLDQHRLQEPAGRPDCHPSSSGEHRDKEFPPNLHPQQQSPPQRTQQSHPQELRQHPTQKLPLQQPPQQSMQQWLQPQPRHHLNEQPQQHSTACQVEPSDRGEAMELPSSEQEEEAPDGLPLDPVLLKREVLRLRRQVADLQQQLRSGTCAACQRLQLAGGQEHGTSLSACSEAMCRLAASAGTSIAACGPRQGSREAETRDTQRGGIPSGAACESSLGGLTCHLKLHATHRQPSGAPERPLSSSRNSAVSTAGTDVQHAEQPGAVQPCVITTTSLAAPEELPSAGEVESVSACSGSEGEYAAAIDGNARSNECWARQLAATAGAPATAATVGRADHMSVVSEASDRGSVWSMASLQSSILSSRSCLSPSISRISVDGSGRGSSGFGSKGGGAVQPGCGMDLQEGTSYGDPLLHSKRASLSSGGGSSCSELGDAVRRGSGHTQAASQAFPAQPSDIQELSQLGSRLGPAPGVGIAASLDTASAIAAVGLPGRGGKVTGGQEPLARQPSPFQSTTGGRAASEYVQLNRTQPWEQVADGADSRGRRRPRRTSSDSDHSLASEPDAVAIATRAPTAPCWAAGVATAMDHTERWKPQHAIAPGGNNTSSTSSSSGGSGCQSRGTAAPSSSPSPPISAVVSFAAVPTCHVVRTKYIPLDDDSDSSDSESDGLLEQKYGIRRTES